MPGLALVAALALWAGPPELPPPATPEAPERPRRFRATSDTRDLLGRVRTTRRVGWSLMGVGLGLVVGSAVALLVWPSPPDCTTDEGCAARYPGARIAVESGLLLGPLMASSGSSALLWGLSYSKARSRRVELTPTIGGLSMNF